MATSKIKLDDTGWITLNSTYPTSYRRKNGVVYVSLKLSGGEIPPTSGQYLLGTLPEGFRPAFTTGAIGSNNRCSMAVGNDGKVVIDQMSGGYSAYMNVHVSYPV